MLPNCLMGLVLTAGLATAGPIPLPEPRPVSSPVATAAPMSIADLVAGARDALFGYLTIPLGAVPFPDGEGPPK